MNMSAAHNMRDRISEDDAFNAAEELIATIMGDNQILSECDLEPEDFAEELHQIIFAEAVRLYRGNQHINPVSLKPAVPKVIKGLTGSPSQYLANLAVLAGDPTVRASFAKNIQIIKASALSRSLAREAQFAMDLAAEGHSLLTLSEEIEMLETRVREKRQRLSELKSGTAAGNAYLAMFQASSRRDGVIGVPIALPEIAEVLSEPVFEAGNLYGLLSSSGEGKSSLTMQLIYGAVKAGHPVQFLSYDQSAAQCVRQMIAQVHEISVNQQRDPMGKMSEKERDIAIKFATWINAQPLDVIRCQREGVSQLVAYARRFIKKHANGKTPFIVIDHIGKVTPKDPKLDAGRISGSITVELKAFAGEADAAVLILNQRNSSGTQRDNPRPIARDLYGGEGAKADYDSVLYLYRAEKYKAEREAIAATDSDWKKINKTFGSDIEGIAEIGAIKVRFGDPSIRRTLKFFARFTRYQSMPKEPQGRML